MNYCACGFHAMQFNLSPVQVSLVYFIECAAFAVTNILVGFVVIKIVSNSIFNGIDYHKRVFGF